MRPKIWAENRSLSGLPDTSWYKHTKMGKIGMPKCHKITKWPWNGRKMFLMVIKLTTFYIPTSKALQIQSMPKFGFSVWKYTIWQPWSTSIWLIRKRIEPGADPTKHDFPNFTHICTIFSQICVILLQICETRILPNFKTYLAYYTSILQKLVQNDCKKLALPENIGR
jgi:hypothetical protein